MLWLGWFVVGGFVVGGWWFGVVVSRSSGGGTHQSHGRTGRRSRPL